MATSILVFTNENNVLVHFYEETEQGTQKAYELILDRKGAVEMAEYIKRESLGQKRLSIKEPSPIHQE